MKLKKFPKNLRTDIKSILLIGLSSIGDNLLISPAIRMIEEACKNPSIDIIVGPRAAVFAEGNPSFSKVYIWDKKSGVRVLVSMLKNKKYDLIIDFRNSLLPYFLKAEYRMTFFLKEFFSKKFTTHESERVIKFLEPYFGINENHGLYFPVKEEEIEESRKIFEKFGVSDADDFIVLNPGAAFEKKRWNKNRFAALGREIMNKYNVTLIIVGNKDDFKVAEEIVSKINCKRVLNLAGQISFRHLACLLLRALLLITNDTGTMHLASAIRCPVVAIFGPGNPMRYGPIGTKSIVVHTERTCFPCKLESRCKKNFICMEDVSVEQVLSAVSRILD